MLKTIRNIAISAFAMILLFAVAGAAYVLFYGGKDSGVQAQQAPASSKPEPSALPKPHTPDPKAPESVGLQALTSPVKPGENSSITVQTLPTSTCTISVTYNNVPSKDSGLASKGADAYGVVTWSWTVDPAAPDGTWPVKVTCFYNKKSAVYIGNLVVSRK